MTSYSYSPTVAGSFGTPFGFEYLLETNRIYIQQQAKLSEARSGINTQNRYNVFDALGRRIYFAAEKSDYWSLSCCGNGRPWAITLYDSRGQPVMVGTRASGSCCGECGNSVEVKTASGMTLGKIIQNCSCSSDSYIVRNDRDVEVFRIGVPGCRCGCCSCGYEMGDFPVMNIQDGKQIGKILKHFGDIINERMTGSEVFVGVHIPIDLDVNLKAVLIYAALLLDFMYLKSQVSKSEAHYIPIII